MIYFPVLKCIFFSLFFFQGQESFASKESLEQLHRFLFVLGVIHVSYSFAAIAFAMIKASGSIWILFSLHVLASYFVKEL